jgi:hypothetical protein
MSKTKAYGYCYDKHGKLVEVSAPVNGKLQPVTKKTKTLTGKIPDNVGFRTLN